MNESIKDTAAFKQTIGPYSSHAAGFLRCAVGDFLKFLKRLDPVWQSGVEQDLLMQRYLYGGGNRSVWPYVSRAYNIGWYSYHINTGQKFYGSVEDQSRAIAIAMKDEPTLRMMSVNNAAVTPIPAFWPVRTTPVREIR